MNTKQLSAILTVCLLFVTTLSFAQGQSFVRIYPAQSYFNDVDVLTSGNYACVGGVNGSNSILVVVYSPTGQKLWEWQDNTSWSDYLSSLTPNTDGGFTVAGSGTTGAMAIRFNAQGGVVWRKTYNIASGTFATSIAQTADGGFAIQNEQGSQGSHLLRLNAQGDSLWHYFNPDPWLSNMAYTSDGGFLITAISNATGGICTIKIDSSGTEEWHKDYAIATSMHFGHLRSIERNGNYQIINSASTIDSGGLILTINLVGDSITSHRIRPTYGLTDIDNTLDGGFVVTGFPDSASGIMVKFDAQMNEQWRNTFNPLTSYRVVQSPDKGYVVIGKSGINAYIMKTDSLGALPFTVVEGRVVSDYNTNCIEDSGEAALDNVLVEASINGYSYYGYTNDSGQYSIQVFDTGTAVLNWRILNNYWVPPACQTLTAPTLSGNNDTVNVATLFAEPIILCPDLSVTISTLFLRRCSSATYAVKYCNNGTLPANNPYLDIEMDPYVIVGSASIPWASQTGNLYRFNLDTVGIGQCGSFNLYVTVDCDSTELGQTHCVSAHIYPDSICLAPNPLWDGSSVKVTGQCSTGDTLDFKIENVGANDMTAPSFFLIAEDNVMFTSGQFQLNAGQFVTERIPGNGSTFTLLADQVEGHPGQSFPMVSIEGCGVNDQGSYSKGFVLQYPQDDQDGFVDILCLPSIGSYDPNDKRAEPKGLNSEGYITATQPLDYTIRFQNTGTDTAFNVILMDTLSPNLDITTLRLNSASHAYTFQIIGSNILEWTFPNILLPDSNVNEPLSHGFVSFAIGQADGNAPGTEITNRAGIYFDFNAVVLTNTTLNTVIEDYKTWFTFIQSPESELALSIFPNPNSGTFSLGFAAKGQNRYEFVVYDLAGAKQFGQTLTGNAPYLLQPDLPTGMYIYQLLENGVAVSVGKVVVNR